MAAGDANGDPAMQPSSPRLPEHENDPAEPDFGAEMADAIVAARRHEFAALSDLNDDADWGVLSKR